MGEEDEQKREADEWEMREEGEGEIGGREMNNG